MNTEKNIKNLAETVAESIFSEKDGNSLKYTVYSRVPVNCIHRIIYGRQISVFPKSLYGSTGKLRIDAVLCVENEIALCVTLNPNARVRRLFRGPLKELLYVELSKTFRIEKFAAYAKATLSRHASRISNRSVRYKIVSYPVQPLCKTDFHDSENNGDVAKSKLISSRAVDENLGITDYGRACGIMYCFFNPPCGSRKVDFSFRAAEKSSEIFDTEEYFKLPLSIESNSLMTLKQRLMCLKLTIPCEKAYAELSAKRLNDFLDAPLSEIIKDNNSLFNQLKYDIADAKKFIQTTAPDFPEHGEIASYGDLANYLYRMKSLITCENYDYDGLKIFFDNIVIDLGNFACASYNEMLAPDTSRYNMPKGKEREKTGIKERLARFNGAVSLTESVFSMPLGHYYYAASLVISSNYPNWLCREKLKKDLGSAFKYYEHCEPYVTKSLAAAVSDEKTNYIQNSGSVSEDEYVSVLYDLLIAPVVDINKVINLKGG